MSDDKQNNKQQKEGNTDTSKVLLSDATRAQLVENMRFYGDMRFKQLTLLMGWLALAGGGVAQYGSTVLAGNLKMKTALAVGSLLFTAVMWVMEVRSTINWTAHRVLVQDLWPRDKRKIFSWLTATNAVLLFHIAIYGFWLWCTHAWEDGWILTAIGIIMGVLILILSIWSYIPLWCHSEG